MPKQVENREYKISDADLKQLADALVNSINRDLTAFAARRITATQVTALKTLISSFDATTTDVELLGELGNATKIKDTIAENIRIAIRPIRNMAENAYGSEGKYNTFGFDELSKVSDNELYRMARRIVRVGTKLQADLTAQGLTATQLPALATLATQLDSAIDAMGDSTETRDLQTQDRVRKGNILWDEMTKLAGIGRSIFEDTDEARYNDYVLVGGNGENEKKPPPPNTKE